MLLKLDRIYIKNRPKFKKEETLIRRLCETQKKKPFFKALTEQKWYLPASSCSSAMLSDFNKDRTTKFSKPLPYHQARLLLSILGVDINAGWA